MRNLASGEGPTRPARPPWCWRRCPRCLRRYPRTSRCPWVAALRWATSCKASPIRYLPTCRPWRSPLPSPPSRRPTPPHRRSVTFHSPCSSLTHLYALLESFECVNVGQVIIVTTSPSANFVPNILSKSHSHNNAAVSKLGSNSVLTAPTQKQTVMLSASSSPASTVAVTTVVSSSPSVVMSTVAPCTSCRCAKLFQLISNYNQNQLYVSFFTFRPLGGRIDWLIWSCLRANIILHHNKTHYNLLFWEELSAMLFKVSPSVFTFECAPSAPMKVASARLPSPKTLVGSSTQILAQISKQQSPKQLQQCSPLGASGLGQTQSTTSPGSKPTIQIKQESGRHT